MAKLYNSWGQALDARSVKRYLIYGLVDPLSGELRYVGLSSSGLRRPKFHAQHARRGDRGYCYNWIRSLQELGLSYEIVVLEETSSSVDLNTLERWWIAFARAWGCALTNLTDGGCGTFGWVPSAETRAKHAVAARSAWSRPDVYARQSAAIRSAATMPVRKTARSATSRAVHAKPDVKIKHREAIVKALAQPGVNARQRAALARPEVKARHRAGILKALARPEVKARQRAATKAALALRVVLTTQWGPL